jgi:hypothetical protein
MDIKKEVYGLIEETPEVSSLKRDQRIDVKYEEGYDPPPFPVILCEDKVSSVANVSRCTEKCREDFYFLNESHGDRCAARGIRILPINQHA